jgi:hypothetical protein
MSKEVVARMEILLEDIEQFCIKYQGLKDLEVKG